MTLIDLMVGEYIYIQLPHTQARYRDIRAATVRNQTPPSLALERRIYRVISVIRVIIRMNINIHESYQGCTYTIA